MPRSSRRNIRALGVRAPGQLAADRGRGRAAEKMGSPSRRRWSVLVLLPIILVAAGCLRSAHAPGLPFTVYGYVYNEEGARVVGAVVAVESPIHSLMSTTDSEGRYWVTVSITGVGDSIKVAASKGAAQGGAGGTVPDGSSSLQVDVIIRSSATTSATKTVTSSVASTTTSTSATSHTSTTTMGLTSTSAISTTSEFYSSVASVTDGNSTSQSTSVESTATTGVLTTTIAYTTTETAHHISYQTSVITTTMIETQPQNLSTIVLSVDRGPSSDTDAGREAALGIVLVSNADFDDLAYNEDLNRITMSVPDSYGSPAFFEISIPKPLVADPADIVFEVDGRDFGFDLEENSEAYSVSFWAPPGERLLSISLGSRAGQSNPGSVQAGTSAGGTYQIPSLVIGLAVLVLLLSFSRRFT